MTNLAKVNKYKHLANKLIHSSLSLPPLSEEGKRQSLLLCYYYYLHNYYINGDLKYLNMAAAILNKRIKYWNCYKKV